MYEYKSCTLYRHTKVFLRAVRDSDKLDSTLSWTVLSLTPAFCTALTIIQYKKYHIFALTNMHSGYTVMKCKIVQYFVSWIFLKRLCTKVDSALSGTVLCWTQRCNGQCLAWLNIVESRKMKKIKKNFLVWYCE